MTGSVVVTAWWFWEPNHRHGNSPHLPSRASHLRSFIQLTFLFLLPSAPIGVTGHQHCNLSATPGPHPGTPRLPIHSFMRDTRDSLKVWESANQHFVSKMCGWSGYPVQNVIDMATWKQVNPEYGQRQRKSAHSSVIQWGCNPVEFSSPCCSLQLQPQTLLLQISDNFYYRLHHLHGWPHGVVFPLQRANKCAHAWECMLTRRVTHLKQTNPFNRSKNKSVHA